MLPRLTNSPSAHFGHLTPMVIGRVYLHFGYPEHPINSPKRPCFFTSPFPSSGHFSSSGSSGWCAMRVPATSRRVVLQSGYPVHARKAPNLPRFSAISFPQFSQYSVLFSASSGISSSISWMKSHSGYREHPRKNPCRLIRSSNSPCPHFSHFFPVGIPALYDTISSPALSRSTMNFSQNSLTDSRHGILPSSISSSSSSSRAVNFTSNTSSKLLISNPHTRSPSIVGVNRPCSFFTYSRSTIVEIIDAYVDGLPIPSSSSSFTSVASVYLGGGSVKCCSGRIDSSFSTCPSVTRGSALPSPSSSFSSSSRSAPTAGIW